MRVDVAGLRVEIAGHRILADARLQAATREFVGLVGPNGSGKTTLLRTVYRALHPDAGSVAVGGDEVWRLPAREAARRTAAVLQDDVPDFEFSVREVVELGRVPPLGRLERLRTDDNAAVTDAMAVAGVSHLADRGVGSLSGGERQRVFVARALAQATPVIVLDEPTNHLDIRAQVELLDLLRSLPVTVVAALHDLNLAAAYCDRIVVLAAGRVVADGPTDDVLDAGLIERVYGVSVHRGLNPLTGRPALNFAPASGSDAAPDPRTTENLTTEKENR